MGREIKPQTDSKRRAAQSRQFKRVCQRVEKHYREFGTPVVLMALKDGCLQVAGSDRLKKHFCKDEVVQQKFFSCTTDKTLQKAELKQDTGCFPQKKPEEIDFEDVSCKFLRAFIAQAVKNENAPSYPLYRQDIRPSWWPDDIPFFSPNHPPATERKGLQFHQLIKVAESYQSSILQKWDTTYSSSSPPKIIPSTAKKPKFTAKEALDTLQETCSWNEFEQVFVGLDLPSLLKPLQLSRCQSVNTPNTNVEGLLGFTALAHSCKDAFTAISYCICGTGKISHEVRLAGLEFGMMKYSFYKEKLQMIQEEQRAHTLYVLGSPTAHSHLPSADSDMLEDTFLQEELMCFVSRESCPGLFQLLLLAGALEIVVFQHDKTDTEVHRCILNVGVEHRADYVHVLWSGWDQITPITAIDSKAADYDIPTQDACWQELIQKGGNTCAMQLHEQCAVSFLPGKARADWVQCSQCHKWLHCICIGLNKQLVSERDFQCCKLVEPSSPNNLMLTQSPFPVYLLDIQSMYPGNGITNTMMDFFIRELLVCSPEVAVVSPLLYQGICRGVKLNHPKRKDTLMSLLKTCCGEEDIFQKHLIAFPCRLETNWHYVLGVVSQARKCVWVLDSLPGSASEVVDNLSVFLSVCMDCSIKLNEEKFEETVPEVVLKSLERNSDEGLKEVFFSVKGRGVISQQNFTKGSFVCEYVGQILSTAQAKKNEETYEKEGKGCFMFYVVYRGKKICIDATREDGRMGRLVNHSRRQANVIPRLYETNNSPRLCFIALRDIHMNEEIVYDYGERNNVILDANPWLQY